MIGIIDYGMGNIFSIKNACRYVNLQYEIVNKADNLLKYDALILPGVGAYGDAIKKLEIDGFDIALADFKNSGKYILGICLGMQLFVTKSFEFGENKGLNMVKGECIKFPNEFNKKKIVIPQISWNKINFPFEEVNEIFDGIKTSEFMYFIHSFYVNNVDKKIITSLTNYDGIEYCSSFNSENIFGLQFHPEKSGKYGLKIYENFKNIVYKK